MNICILLLLIPITQGKYTCEISLSLDFILHCIYIYTGVQLSFIPSQAITIQQTAVYKCSVDNNGITIQWIVNGNSSTDSSITDLGIITYDIGTQNSSLTIPGNPELNNTIVTCIASGLVDMMGYFNTSSATLFIQGIITCKCYCTLDDTTSQIIFAK